MKKVFIAKLAASLCCLSFVSIAAAVDAPKKLLVAATSPVSFAGPTSKADCAALKSKIIDISVSGKIEMTSSRIESVNIYPEKNKFTNRKDHVEHVGNIDLKIVTFTENIGAPPSKNHKKTNNSLFSNGSIVLPLDLGLNRTMRTGYLSTAFCRAILIELPQNS